MAAASSGPLGFSLVGGAHSPAALPGSGATPPGGCRRQRQSPSARHDSWSRRDAWDSAEWSFLTNHARVLVFIAHDPDARLRDLAAAVGVTERAAYGIVADLTEAEYIIKEKEGRRNRYHIQAHLPLPDSIVQEPTVGDVLNLLVHAERNVDSTPTHQLADPTAGMDHIHDRPRSATNKETDMTDVQGEAQWNVAEWHGKMLVDRGGEKIGKLQDVYVDVETDEPQFATVKEGLIGRHLTFVPLGGIQVGPDGLQVSVTKDLVRSAPDIEMHGEELSQADESTLYHHFELNYTPIGTESGRRLARR